jgi:hypothetical protein
MCRYCRMSVKGPAVLCGSPTIAHSTQAVPIAANLRSPHTHYDDTGPTTAALSRTPPSPPWQRPLVWRQLCGHPQDVAEVSQRAFPHPRLAYLPALIMSRSKLMPSKESGDARIPSGASRWTQEVLALLNAEYVKEDCASFTFDKLSIPSELQNGLPFSITKSDPRNGRNSHFTCKRQ